MKKAEGQILVGWACRDITPIRPVSLQGQFYKRISEGIHDPLSVTAWALEGDGETQAKEQVIMVSCDLIDINKQVQSRLRELVKLRIPDFDTDKLLLNATHIHTAPAPYALIDLPGSDEDEGLMTEAEYRQFLLERLTEVVVESWNNRKEGGVSWTLGHAVVGHCRRTVYADGSAMMYGSANREDFTGMESGSDHGVDMLFCWDENEKLTGIVINLACPAQVMEAKYVVSADYWGQVRKELKKRYSEDLFVLAQCSAAGDQSPRDLPRNYRGEPDMWDWPGAAEIAQRICEAVDRVYQTAKKDIKTNVHFRHKVKSLELPVWKVSRENYEKALEIYNKLRAKEPDDSKSPDSAYARFVSEIKANEAKKGPGPYDDKYSDYVTMRYNEAVIKRYESQDETTVFPMELHTIRLGDVAFVCNPFELFLNYGLQIKARSKSAQTFLIQLSCASGGYLPSAAAVQRGGYGALVANGSVGPQGGKILVDETVREINEFWDD